MDSTKRGPKPPWQNPPTINEITKDKTFKSQESVNKIITKLSQLFNTHMGKNTASQLNKALVVSTLSILSKINSETSDKNEARENEKIIFNEIK